MGGTDEETRLRRLAERIALKVRQEAKVDNAARDAVEGTAK
jgi:hypothetical protein